MSEDRRVDREGIHIDRDLADQIAIEEDLDANVEGEYRFPSPERRRLSGWVFSVAAIVSAFAFEGGWLVGIGFAALAVWMFLSSWPLSVDEHQAMRNAAAVVDFPIGHASAAIRFHGWRSRPRNDSTRASVRCRGTRRPWESSGSVAKIPHLRDEHASDRSGTGDPSPPATASR